MEDIMSDFDAEMVDELQTEQLEQLQFSGGYREHKTEEDDMDELSLDQLNQVSGGVQRVVNTNTEDKAAIRSGPFKAPGNQIDALVNGTIVDTVDDELVFDPETQRNYVKIKFINRNGNPAEGWIAASIVGLPR